MHPTWRDLVIERLSSDGRLRRHFLSHCGVHGIMLALSTEGGATGERRLPLMVDDGDWDTLADRLYALVPTAEPGELGVVLAAFESALAQLAGTPAGEEAQVLARLVLERVTAMWSESREPVSLAVIEGWLAVSRRLELPLMPTSLGATWAELLPTAAPDLGDRQEVQRFADWVTLCELLSDFSHTMPRTLRLGDQHVALMAAFVEAVAAEAPPDTPEPVLRALDAIEALRPDIGPRARRCALILREDLWGRERLQAALGTGVLGDDAAFAEDVGSDVRRVLADL